MDEILKQITAFARERDWEKFHTPKNLSMALAVEAAELMEHFQWSSEHDSDQLTEDKRRAVSHELADVFMYTLLMADRLNIDIISAAQEKIAVNATRYPVDLVRGSAKKHHEYD